MFVISFTYIYPFGLQTKKTTGAERMKQCKSCKYHDETFGGRCAKRVPWYKEVRGACADFEEKLTSGNTVVRLCVCTDCVNNRAGVGEYGCNCKEIEIQEGKCRQYLKQQTPPLRFT
jgi:hypothetical protein